MEYSNDMQDVYKNIEDYNPIKKGKILIVFDDMIADMINNNKLNPIVTELFIVNCEFIEMKKAKGTKKCIIKKTLTFEDYKKCLFDNEPMLKSQQRFKSENHEVYTENINKIALSSNDDKRIIALDEITSYPSYGCCGED